MSCIFCDVNSFLGIFLFRIFLAKTRFNIGIENSQDFHKGKN